MTGLRGSGSVPSLPPPRPKSPPDLYGKRRELAKVQMLEREISFLEEELKSIESLQPASVSCKEVADLVTEKTESDPLTPTTKKTRRSCRFWKWLCRVSCFSFSWVCCCSCLPRLQMPRCCDCDCDCDCNCEVCNCCCNPCVDSKMPKCHCFSCWDSQCFKKFKCCSLSCCYIPKCPSCPSCSCERCCTCPTCPKLNICSCGHSICCYPCYLCY